jgi:hypothetical protein
MTWKWTLVWWCACIIMHAVATEQPIGCLDCLCVIAVCSTMHSQHWFACWLGLVFAQCLARQPLEVGRKGMGLLEEAVTPLHGSAVYCSFL